MLLKRDIVSSGMVQKLIWFFYALCGLFLLWLMGLVSFYSFVVFHNQPHHLPSDMGSVFTGSKGRIETGLSLVRTGRLKHLLISGMRHHALPQNEGKKPLPKTVQLGFCATDTRGNIEETVFWAKKNNQSRIVLITADYHMPRCLLLGRLYGKPCTFLPYPLETSLKEKLKKGFSEYHKYIWSLFWGHPLKDSFPPSTR